MNTNNSKIIIGLDPSSTVCGYAVKHVGGSLIQAGLIMPERKSAGSFARIRTMRLDLLAVLDNFKPDTVLIEWTKGKVNINRHHGQGAGLAVYGCGVGGIGVQCDIWCGASGSSLIPINENDWTRGVSKAERQLAIAGKYPEYKIEDDLGGDISDAIGIIDWYQKENLFKN